VDPIAILVSALLGLDRGSGHVLLGHGLESAADAVAGLADRWNITSLARRGTVLPQSAAVNVLVSDPARPFPLLTGRVWGMVLHGPLRDHEAAEAARVLTPGGRVVVIQPGESTADQLAGAGLEQKAADDRAILAMRPLSGRS
jgi:hypothetical protein